MFTLQILDTFSRVLIEEEFYPFGFEQPCIVIDDGMHRLGNIITVRFYDVISRIYYDVEVSDHELVGECKDVIFGVLVMDKAREIFAVHRDVIFFRKTALQWYAKRQNEWLHEQVKTFCKWGGEQSWDWPSPFHDQD